MHALGLILALIAAAPTPPVAPSKTFAIEAAKHFDLRPGRAELPQSMYLTVAMFQDLEREAADRGISISAVVQDRVRRAWSSLSASV